MIIISAMNMATFDLNLLRVLDALLCESSTVRAAQRVGLSQPAVSAALGRLRDALGDPLFVRRGPRLEATDYAKSLATPLREHLVSLERLLSGPGAFDPATATEIFRISGVDFFADMLMPALGELILAGARGIRIHHLDLVPRNYLDTLDRGTVDLVLLPKVDLPDWTEWRPLFHSPFVMIARAGHPRLTEAGIAERDTVPLDLFCDLDHVLMSTDGRARANMDEVLEQVGRSRRVVMTLPYLGGVCRCVASGDFVSMVPRQLAQHLAPTLNLVLYEPPVPMPVPLIGMVWHRRATTSPPHRWLRETVARLLLPLDEKEAPLLS